MRKLILNFFLLLFSLDPLIALEKGQYGGNLIVSSVSPPNSVNPITSDSVGVTDITNMMFRSLLELNIETYEVKPNFAYAWKSDAEKLEWTFYLRDDLFWSDGHRLTSDDVVFTFNAIVLNPQIKSVFKNMLIVGQEKISIRAKENQIHFTLPRSISTFLSIVATVPILPKHIYQHSVNENRFDQEMALAVSPETIVVNGPFQLESLNKDAAVFKRNPHYFKKNIFGDKLPYLDSLTIQFVSSLDHVLIKFLVGEIDIFGLRGGRFRGEDYFLLKPREAVENFTILNIGYDFTISFLAFNRNIGVNPVTGIHYVDPIKSAWFRNKYFRKAIACTISQKELIDKTLRNFGTFGDSPLSPISKKFYNPAVIKYPFSLEKAREYLTQGGFSLSEKGKALLDPNGNKVEFNLNTSPERTLRRQTSIQLIQNLKKLGITVHFNPPKPGELVTILTKTYAWDTMIIGLTGEVDPDLLRTYYHSKSTNNYFNPEQVNPSTSWEKEIDEILDKAAVSTDLTERKKLYDRWQMILSDEVPLVFLPVPSFMTAFRNYVGNYHPKPSPKYNALYDIDQIFIRR
jgi:peptide/nickel transport system substrate-binding protein